MSSCELNLGDQCMYVCMYVRMYVCTYVRIYVCTYVRMYVYTLLSYRRTYVRTYVRMYVYEDSNFGFFRIPHVYVYAHKWLEHQILCKSLPVSNFTLCYTLLCRNFYQKMGVFCTFFFSIKIR